MKLNPIFIGIIILIGFLYFYFYKNTYEGFFTKKEVGDIFSRLQDDADIYNNNKTEYTTPTDRCVQVDGQPDPTRWTRFDSKGSGEPNGEEGGWSWMTRSARTTDGIKHFLAMHPGLHEKRACSTGNFWNVGTLNNSNMFYTDSGSMFPDYCGYAKCPKGSVMNTASTGLGYYEEGGKIKGNNPFKWPKLCPCLAKDISNCQRQEGLNCITCKDNYYQFPGDSKYNTPGPTCSKKKLLDTTIPACLDETGEWHPDSPTGYCKECATGYVLGGKHHPNNSTWKTMCVPRPCKCGYTPEDHSIGKGRTCVRDKEWFDTWKNCANYDDSTNACITCLPGYTKTENPKDSCGDKKGCWKIECAPNQHKYPINGKCKQLRCPTGYDPDNHKCRRKICSGGEVIDLNSGQCRPHTCPIGEVFWKDGNEVKYDNNGFPMCIKHNCGSQKRFDETTKECVDLNCEYGEENRGNGICEKIICDEYFEEMNEAGTGCQPNLVYFLRTKHRCLTFCL